MTIATSFGDAIAGVLFGDAKLKLTDKEDGLMEASPSTTACQLVWSFCHLAVSIRGRAQSVTPSCTRAPPPTEHVASANELTVRCVR